MKQPSFPPTKEQPKLNVGLVVIVASVLVGAGIGLYFLTPVGALVEDGTACKDAAKWHHEQAVKQTTLEAVELHNLKGDSYASLSFLKGDCRGWQEDK